MKRLLSAAVMALVGLVSATGANASPYDDATVVEQSWRKPVQKNSYVTKKQRRTAATRRSSSSGSRHAVGGRPSRWCGWWMRTQKGGGPEMNLAWNWSKWGSPSGPQVGAVVVWRHHVGMITGRTADGRWIVKSGNDGGRVRERARSVAGAVFRVG